MQKNLVVANENTYLTTMYKRLSQKLTWKEEIFEIFDLKWSLIYILYKEMIGSWVWLIEKGMCGWGLSKMCVIFLLENNSFSHLPLF